MAIIASIMLFTVIRLFVKPAIHPCKKDSTKNCPLWYGFNDNGTFISGGHAGCCKIQDQIKAADRLHKLVKEKNLKIDI